MRAGRDRRRAAVTAIVLLPLAGMLAGALLQAARPGPLPELACWLLPKGQVMAAPTGRSCPIAMLETIRRVEVHGRAIAVSGLEDIQRLLPVSGDSLPVSVDRSRGGSAEEWVEVPVRTSTRGARMARVGVAAVATALMLSAPLFLLWRSSARAAVPLCLLYAAVSVVSTAMLAGQHSRGMTRMAVCALILAPAALAHLASTFPRERAILREIPGIASIPYAAAAALVAIGWIALERDPLLGPPFLWLLLALGGGAWLGMLSACGLALRASESAIERARARLVFFGALLGPLAPTLAIAPAIGDAARLGVLYLWTAMAVTPLPIALAISPYNLFDLGWDARNAAARVVHVGLAALLVSLIFAAATALGGSTEILGKAAPLYLVSCLGVAAIEVLRSGTPGLLEAAAGNRLRRLRVAREALEEHLSMLQDGDETARCVGAAIRDGVGARKGCVFLSTFGEWRPAYPFGPSSGSWSDLLVEALQVLGEDSILHLPADPEREARAKLLRAARIEAVASIDRAGARYGIVLAGHGGSTPYTGVEIDFIRTVATQAAVALRNAHLTSELVDAERRATTGRLAAALAEDLGKDLGWIRRLARRLPERFCDEERLGRDARMIRELSDGLAEAVERFATESTRPAPSQELDTLDRLVDRAVRRVSRTHGPGRVIQNLDPQLRNVALHEHLERALGNLLDNALHASPTGAAVHLFGTLEDDRVRITVEDRGPGIPSSLADRVFEAGVSTRLAEGGAGVGLTVAREIVEGLGGTIGLELGSGGGTRASIRMPLPQETRGPAP